MAGLINSEDIAAVKARSSIEDVVREHVTLRSAGPGSLKGLCPFHDEKSPSFNIRPAVGAWHCFGCGEGGDVISFVQKVDHLTFSEAVERLAQKLGMELRYEDGAPPARRDSAGAAGSIEAHRVAEEYYTELLPAHPEAARRPRLPARPRLQQRARQAVRRRLRATRGRGPRAPPARQGLHRRRARHRRDRRPWLAGSLRPVPRSARLADPRHHR